MSQAMCFTQSSNMSQTEDVTHHYLTRDENDIWIKPTFLATDVVIIRCSRMHNVCAEWIIDRRVILMNTARKL